MSLAFPITAAVIAAACGWRASGVIAGLSEPPGPATRPGSAAAPDSAARPIPRSARWLTPLISAALVLAATLRLHQVLIAGAACWLVLCGVPLAVIDLRVRRLPDALTGACIAGIATLLTAAAVVSGHVQSLARAGLAAASVALFFALLALARPGSAGLGDAKLGLSTGAFAAWFGWGVLLTSLLAAFLLAAGYGLYLLATRRATLPGGSLPFGPFLLAGCLLTTLLAGAVS